MHEPPDLIWRLIFLLPTFAARGSTHLFSSVAFCLVFIAVSAFVFIPVTASANCIHDFGHDLAPWSRRFLSGAIRSQP